MYSDEELRKMCEAAQARHDVVAVAALLAVAVAHENGKDNDLLDMLMGFNHIYLHGEKEQGGSHGHDLTAIDPDAIIQL